MFANTFSRREAHRPRSLDRLLRFLFAAGVGVWVGGATTLQILMARATRSDDPRALAAGMDQVNWAIRSVFIPAGVLAAPAGLLLVARTDATFRDRWVERPILLYGAVIVTGSVYSLPEYTRLLALADQRGGADPELRRRLRRATWVNRVELALVYRVLFDLLARTGIRA